MTAKRSITKRDGTPVTADDILDADLRNTLKKVGTGKPLSKAERALVEAHLPSSSDLKTKNTVSTDKAMREMIRDRFGISERKTFDWIKRLKPVHKHGRKWDATGALDEIAERRQRNKNGSAENNDLKREKLSLECDILRQRRDRDRGELVPREDVQDTLTELLEGVRNGLENWCQRISAERRDVQLSDWAEQQAQKAVAMVREALVHEG